MRIFRNIQYVAIFLLSCPSHYLRNSAGNEAPVMFIRVFHNYRRRNSRILFPEKTTAETLRTQPDATTSTNRIKHCPTGINIWQKDCRSGAVHQAVIPDMLRGIDVPCCGCNIGKAGIYCYRKRRHAKPCNQNKGQYKTINYLSFSGLHSL